VFDSTLPKRNYMPQPFTYPHFIQAIQSSKEDMLMFYIDEAVAIYCKLKGKPVGFRPANRKDSSLEYDDAFEAANYAVCKVAKKIGAYNPEMDTFKDYLDKALGNALKDIMEEDGRSDFFDQTSKKKHKDDEPEKHIRVNLDDFRGDADSAAEPDSSASDMAARVREHKDDALETMIRFIDTLPEIQRAAVYASAFGQVLRPDLEGYGRNYAEIVAKMYQTTALYIRKLASDGKKAALEEARNLGFNERSIGTISIGMLQVRATPTNPYDAVLQAIDKLDPYQQFMLLRHLANTQN